MNLMRRLISGLVLSSCLYAAPLEAQDSSSMQVGNATVSIGGGSAILTLPDASSFVARFTAPGAGTFIEGFKFSDDFDDTIGWNTNASISVPVSGSNTISLSSFWSRIEDDDSFTCLDSGVGDSCLFFPLGSPNNLNQIATTATTGISSSAERQVDHWGLSLESKWLLDPGVMGITRAPNRRYFSLAADYRKIDQDMDANLQFLSLPGQIINYTEDLETDYYGAFASWGGDYNPLFFSGLWKRLGLQSSFQIRGGVYYADTDYDGRIVDGSGSGLDGVLSLSDSEIAFIGGLKHETTKRIGKRASLSLMSEYEYYSYVPELLYNQADPFRRTGQVGTTLDDEDALSMRTSLRLTIKLGPDSVFEESLK